MKYLLSILLTFFSVSMLSAQTYYLSPSSFFSAKGQKAEIGLFYGNGYDTTKAKKTPVSQLNGIFLYAGGKPVDLKPHDSELNLSVELQNAGTCMISAKKEALVSDLEKDDVARSLSDDGFNELVENMDDEEVLNVNYVFAAKTLLMADKPSGSVHEEKVNEDLEILLLQNPYKLKYGEDIMLQVLFKGKPLKKARTEVYTRTLNGGIFSEIYSTDEEGKAYVKLNRAGDWLAKVVHVLPEGKDVNYTRWCSTFSFGFK